MKSIQVLDAGMESTKILEANYPENLGRLFVINGNIRINWNKVVVDKTTWCFKILLNFKSPENVHNAVCDR